jgi:2-dehydro-3-deoxyphosphogalactonate aldolase
MQTRKFIDAFKEMPLVPALRGISEKNVIDTGQLLIDNGITIFEIPIRTGNAIFSPIDAQALRCIDLLSDRFGKYVNVSAGTVMQISDLDKLKGSGITNCFSINLNTDLLEQAVKEEFTFSPGIETISEAIQAIKLGAFGIKLFPSVFVEPDVK